MTNLSISGMTCRHCKKAVEEALTNAQGVESVDVNLEQGAANLTALIAAVKEEDYQAKPA